MKMSTMLVKTTTPTMPSQGKNSLTPTYDQRFMYQICGPWLKMSFCV